MPPERNAACRAVNFERSAGTSACRYGSTSSGRSAIARSRSPNQTPLPASAGSRWVTITSEFRWICRPARSPTWPAGGEDLLGHLVEVLGAAALDERPQVEPEALQVRVPPLLGLLRRDRQGLERLERLRADRLDERGRSRQASRGRARRNRWSWWSHRNPINRVGFAARGHLRRAGLSPPGATRPRPAGSRRTSISFQTPPVTYGSSATQASTSSAAREVGEQDRADHVPGLVQDRAADEDPLPLHERGDPLRCGGTERPGAAPSPRRRSRHVR